MMFQGCDEESSSGSNNQNETCTKGTFKCSEGLTGSIPCGTDGRWEDTAKACGPNNTCTPEDGQCHPVNVSGDCTPGAWECPSEGSYRICDSTSHWGTPQSCDPSTPKCNADKKTCEEDNSQPAQECEPNTKQCVAGSENLIDICTEEGVWLRNQECPQNKPVCQNDECVSTDPGPTQICTPGVDFCFGGNAESAGMFECTADGQKGEVRYYCPAGCNELGTTCAERCDAQDIRCLDDHSATIACVDGYWQIDSIQPCDKGLTCNDTLKKCVECTPGVDFCTGDGESTGMYTCNINGERGERIYACDACTEDGKACKCETEGERRCTSNHVEVCKDGAWTNAKDCSRSQICNDQVGSICIPAATNGGVCREDETICRGNDLLKCTQGLYQEAQACDDAKNTICTYSVSDGLHRADCISTQDCEKITICTGNDGILNTPSSCDQGTIKPGNVCGKSQFCSFVEVSSPIPESTTVEAQCLNYTSSGEEASFSCDKDILSVYRNGKPIKLADCSEYGLTCKEGLDGGCVPKDARE